MKNIGIFFIFSFLFAIDLTDINPLYTNKSQPKTINGNFENSSKFTNQLLFNSIDPSSYIVGPGDSFLFNMIIPSRTVNLELITSPTSTILIPGIGIVDVNGNTLSQTYDKIVNSCKEIYEDAYVYVNILKLRQFKVFVNGETKYSAMYPALATNRVSDLIESNQELSKLFFESSIYSDKHDILAKYLSYTPLNAMIGKDIILTRDTLVIKINLFDYYINGNFDYNPILLEGDILTISNSNDVTIIGEINSPKRKSDFTSMTYNDMIEHADGLSSNADLENIIVINNKLMSIYIDNHIDMLIEIDSKYRSDYDESYLRARQKTVKGIVNIKNKDNLISFLNSVVSSGDMIIIPPKVNFVEIIGGVNNPGTYQYNSSYSLLDYIQLAGNFNSLAKKKNIYLIDLISGSKSKLKMGYILKRGDIIFIEEELEYKSWDTFRESIQLAGTLTTMALVLYNIWDKLGDGN